MDSSDFLELAHERDGSALRTKLSTDWLHDKEVARDASITRVRNHLLLSKATQEIATTLGNYKCVLATARKRAGMKGNLLHPIATWPRSLNSYFLDPDEYQYFTFDPNAFEGGDSTKLPSDDDNWHGRIYDLTRLDDGGKGRACFAGRIKAFLNRVRDALDKEGIEKSQIDDLESSGICVVLGGIRPDAEFVPPRVNAREFYYFLALYLLPGTACESRDTPRGDIAAVAKEMFRAMEISAAIDKEDFELEGLELLSDLVPALTEPDTAPSDAIAFFLNRLEDALKRHTLGIDDTHTWVKFIAIDTVIDEKGLQTPQFQIFPHHAASGSKETAIGAFLLSHPKRLSTVKLILRLWARQYGIPLSSEFESLFAEVPVLDSIFHVDSDSACFSADDPGDLWNLWKRINLNVAPNNRTTRCTLGFVIENRKPPLIVPYAIIAFESDIPDAFSRADIDRFRAVIDACSKLFLGLHLSVASFDIRGKIRNAFADTSTLSDLSSEGSVERIAFGKFRFELLRVDRDRLIELIGSTDQRIWEGGGLTRKEAEEYLSAHLEKMPGGEDALIGETLDNEETSRIVFDKTLGERTKWIVENEVDLHELWEKSGKAGEIYEFLANIPSNIVWHCYLNAVPRAIAFRTDVVHASNHNFMVMQHGGRSALAMFVFSPSPNEFRQIIKLSDQTRIYNEATNYRKFVRYNVPLSARLPTSGKAYEADGDTTSVALSDGPIPRSKRAFGALVSDLIAGYNEERRGPVTFLGKLIQLIISDADEQSIVNAKDRRSSLEEFRYAIKYQFENNTGRWKTWPEREKWVESGRNTTETVREIIRIRLPKDKESSLSIIERRLGSPTTDCDSQLQLLVGRLTGVKFDALSKALAAVDRYGAALPTMNATDLGAVIHGDLNARNLVWSQDYVKFFIIDFERVRLGFYGADQLRLAFSLISDLIVDAYQLEPFGAWPANPDIARRVRETDLIAADLLRATTYAAEVLATMREATAQDGGSVPAADESSIASVALEEIFKTISSLFRKEFKDFWYFSITMMAAKQLEYALRDIDESCTSTLKLLREADVKGDQGYNFYHSYSAEDLKKRTHDKFVLGKIGRVLFAYFALVKILMHDGQRTVSTGLAIKH